MEIKYFLFGTIFKIFIANKTNKLNQETELVKIYQTLYNGPEVNIDSSVASRTINLAITPDKRNLKKCIKNGTIFTHREITENIVKLSDKYDMPKIKSDISDMLDCKETFIPQKIRNTILETLDKDLQTNEYIAYVLKIVIVDLLSNELTHFNEEIVLFVDSLEDDSDSMEVTVVKYPTDLVIIPNDDPILKRQIYEDEKKKGFNIIFKNLKKVILLFSLTFITNFALSSSSSESAVNRLRMNDINLSNKLHITPWYSNAKLSIIGTENIAGPDRPKFSVESPPEYITFNSFSDIQKKLYDSEGYEVAFTGDERYFTKIRELGGEFSNQVDLKPGKTYEVMMYFNNDIKKNFNWIRIPESMRFRARIPDFLRVGESGSFNSYIYCENANPKEVWSNAIGLGSLQSPIAITYIPGSLRAVSSNWNNEPRGLTINGEPLFVEDTALDMEKANIDDSGSLTGAIFYKFMVKESDLKMRIFISKKGKSQWNTAGVFKPNEEFDVCIYIENMSEHDQDNIYVNTEVFEDSTIKYIEETTNIKLSGDSKFTPSKTNIKQEKGIFFSKIKANEEAYATFSMKCSDADIFYEQNTKLVVYFDLDTDKSSDIAQFIILNIMPE